MKARVVTLPDLPQMDDRGKPPRPLVVLVGSAGTWQGVASRDLAYKAGAAGAVVRTDTPVQGVVHREGHHPHVVLAGIKLLVPLADLVVVWVDSGPVWLWLEMGQWIFDGSGGSGVLKHLGAAVQQKFVWGIEERESFHHTGHLRYLLVENGWAIRPTLEDTITAAGVRLQERRR